MNLMSAPQSTTCLLFCHCTCDCHVQCPWPPCSQPAALQLSKYCVSGCLSVWFRLKEYTRRHSAGQCRVNRRAVTCVIICRQPRFLLSSLIQFLFPSACLWLFSSFSHSTFSLWFPSRCAFLHIPMYQVEKKAEKTQINECFLV